MADTFTICTKCKHLLNTNPRGPRRDVWHQHYCKASPQKPTRNPYNGKMVTENECGYEHCRDLNHGACPKFKENIE